MKIMGKLVTAVVVLGVIVIGGAVILPGMTKNRGSELAMAVDNLNPLVKRETVYASTSVKPKNSFIGGGGEKEYTYQLMTYNRNGQARKLTFLSQWRLKPDKYLAITAKGQNVETWKATQRVPDEAKSNLAMS